MIPGMVLRDEDQDPMDRPLRNAGWGLALSLICWAMAFLAIAGLAAHL